MARGSKSNFDNEIKSSIGSAKAKPKEGSKAEEAKESPAFEAREQAAMKRGASPRAADVAAQGNPQNTNHLQGAAATPGAHMPQPPPMQPHMSGAGPMENDPVIHASSIAHAILRHGSTHSIPPPQGDTQSAPNTNLSGMMGA